MTNLKRRVTYQYGTLVPEPRRRGPDVGSIGSLKTERASGFDVRRSLERSTKCRSEQRQSEPARSSDSLRMRRRMRAPRRWAGLLTATSRKFSNRVSSAIRRGSGGIGTDVVSDCRFLSFHA